VSTQVEVAANAPLVGDAIELDGRSLLAPVPLRRRRTRVASWAAKRLLLDLIMLGIGAGVLLISEEKSGVDSLPAQWMLALAGTALILYTIRGAYSWQMGLDVMEDARLVLTQTALAMVVVLAVWAVSMPGTIAPGAAVGTWLFLSALVLVGRLVLFGNEAYARRNHRTLRPTLIIGSGSVATWLARRLLEHPEFGLRPLGFVDDDPPGPNGVPATVSVLGAIGDLESLAAEHDVEQVIIAFSRASHDDLLGVIDRCNEAGLPVALVPRLFERSTREVALEHLGGLPLIRVRPIDPRGWYFHLKYGLDPVVAALILFLTLPALALSALAVWISVGRPILFRQTRVGRDGNVFEMLKFRTMRAPTHAEGEMPALPPGIAPGGVEGDDDRRTRVGRILRETSLDELPQLLNVLKGEMSLVGPRPERPEFVENFNSNVRGYDRRHRVKCGITGWSQISGLRGQTSISDRAEYDNYYIENFSFWLDVKILVLTALTFLQGLLRRNNRHVV
jgi:exopolysaccharide biosynthesis polyprenyl glycosylphosphotransferase